MPLISYCFNKPVLFDRIGDFQYLNDRVMSKPGHNNPDKMWPRDYLVRRIRLNENRIILATQHQNTQILSLVLKDLLATIRLDFNDFVMAVPMAGFMFLYLERHADAYDFIKFWIQNVSAQEKRGAYRK